MQLIRFVDQVFMFLCIAISGKGCVYSFDPVGSYERETYRAGGSASALLQPLLDNQVRCMLHWLTLQH